MHDHVTKAVTLVNAGSLMYEYSWKLGGSPRLAVSPATGSVNAGDRVACELSFSPISAQQLNQHRVTCQVVNGRTYTLLLSGVQLVSQRHLLWTRHDRHLAALLIGPWCLVPFTLVEHSVKHTPLGTEHSIFIYMQHAFTKNGLNL